MDINTCNINAGYAEPETEVGAEVVVHSTPSAVGCVEKQPHACAEFQIGDIRTKPIYESFEEFAKEFPIDNDKDYGLAAQAATAKEPILISETKTYYVRRKNGTVQPAQVLQKRSSDGPNSNSLFEYFVHYVGFNRRLDEWVSPHRISDNASDLGGLPMPNKPCTKQWPNGDNDNYGDRKVTRYQKRCHDEINHVQNSLTKLSASQAALEKEHDSITKIKYIDKVQFGYYEINTWYFSPFPEEYGKARQLYICEYCLKYMRFKGTYTTHLAQCQHRHPPGREIYRKGIISIYEVDGKDHTLYCQLLALMAKLFLDHKVLFYDLEPFTFYVLCEFDKDNRHLVGYFSREKESANFNNLSCILIMPPHQRKGYGKLLIALSYELSRQEGRVGTPEKPLSDLGRLSYRSYWAYTLLTLMKNCNCSTQSIKILSEMSGIMEEDIIYTLQSMKMLKYWKGQHVICVTPKTIKDYLNLPQFKEPKITIDVDCLDWKSKKDGQSTAP